MTMAYTYTFGDLETQVRLRVKRSRAAADAVFNAVASTLNCGVQIHDHEREALVLACTAAQGVADRQSAIALTSLMTRTSTPKEKTDGKD